MRAEKIRSERSKITKQLSASPQHREDHKSSERILSLEKQLYDHWQYKQAQKLYKQKLAERQRLEDRFLIKRKVELDMIKQKGKFIRRERPNGPKLDPLPYMKRIREALSKTIEQADSVENTEEPDNSSMRLYLKKNLGKGIKVQPSNRHNSSVNAPVTARHKSVSPNLYLN